MQLGGVMSHDCMWCMCAHLAWRKRLLYRCKRHAAPHATARCLGGVVCGCVAMALAN